MKNTKMGVRILIGFILIFVVIGFVILSLYNNELPTRIFGSVSELSVADKYAISEIVYDDAIEPNADNISERWAKTLSFDGKNYDLYAYEFVSSEEAKSFFVNKTDWQTEENHGYTVDFSKGTPFVIFYNNNLYMLYYVDADYRDVENVLSEITESFEYDLKEID